MIEPVGAAPAVAKPKAEAKSRVRPAEPSRRELAEEKPRGPGAKAAQRGRGERLTGLEMETTRRSREGRRGKPQGKPQRHGFEMPTTPVVHEVTIPETITVADLAAKMAVKAVDVVKVLFGMGVMATINQSIDQDTAILVVEEMGHIAKPLTESDLEAELLAKIPEGALKPRPPIITVMGTLTTARPPSWTTSAAPRWPQAKPAVSPSTSAPITSKRRKGLSPFLIPRATRRSLLCGRVVSS